MISSFCLLPRSSACGTRNFFLNLQVIYDWNRPVWVVKNIGKGFT